MHRDNFTFTFLHLLLYSFTTFFFLDLIFSLLKFTKLALGIAQPNFPNGRLIMGRSYFQQLILSLSNHTSLSSVQIRWMLSDCTYKNRVLPWQPNPSILWGGKTAGAFHSILAKCSTEREKLKFQSILSFSFLLWLHVPPSLLSDLCFRLKRSTNDFGKCCNSCCNPALHKIFTYFRCVLLLTPSVKELNTLTSPSQPRATNNENSSFCRTARLEWDRLCMKFHEMHGSNFNFSGLT